MRFKLQLNYIFIINKIRKRDQNTILIQIFKRCFSLFMSRMINMDVCNTASNVKYWVYKVTCKLQKLIMFVCKQSSGLVIFPICVVLEKVSIKSCFPSLLILFIKLVYLACHCIIFCNTTSTVFKFWRGI